MYCSSVNVEKTKRTQKICFNESKWNIINNEIFEVFGILFSLGILCYSIHFEIVQDNYIHRDALGSFFTIFLPLCFFLLMVFRYSNYRKLSKVPTLTKDDILNAVNELNWTIDYIDHNYMVISPDNWKQITIIFDDKITYVHSLRQGRVSYSKNNFAQEQLLNKIEELNKNAV